MAIQAPPNFNLAVTRLCDYLSTLPFATAMRIFGQIPQDHQLGDYAAAVVAGLPADFFNRTPPNLSVQRFVYENGKITIQALANTGEQAPWPTPVEADFGSVAQSQLPPPNQRAMNSFMVFRCFIAPLLPNIPQRMRSVAISNLWQAETERGPWELIARAYTCLRNNYEVQDTTLAAFLQEAAGKIGLPTPAEYVKKALGFELEGCDLAICLEGGIGRGNHYHLTSVALVDPTPLQINTLTMEELLKPFIGNPNNAPEVNNEPVESVMSVARGMTTAHFDTVLNMDQVTDSENEWTFTDIYGEADASLSGNPLNDPAYVRLLQREAWLMQNSWSQWNSNDPFAQSDVALQANAQ